MIGKALHEGSVAVFTGMCAADIRIDGVIRHRQICLCHDILDFNFLDDHICFSKPPVIVNVNLYIHTSAYP